MKMIKNIFLNEWILLIRNKFFAIPLIINIFCWGYIVISYEIASVHYETVMGRFYIGFMWMIMLNLLIVGLISIYMAGKDRESKFEQLVVTYQVKNTEWLMGKWLITQLYGLAITIFTIMIQLIWLASTNMEIRDITKNILYVFVQMEGAFFLIISIGFLLGVVIRNMFAYLTIPVILLISLMLPFDKTGTSLPFDNPRFHLLTPFDYMFIQTPYEGIWGIHRVFENTVIHQICAFLIGIIITLLTFLLFRKNRRSQRESKIIPVLIMIIIIPAILLSSTSFKHYNQAFKEYVALGNFYMQTYSEDGQGELHEWEWENSYYDENLDDQPYEFSIEKEDLTVKLQSDHQISVQSELLIKNNGNEPVKDVYLTLFHGLKVYECTSPSDVICARDGDFITLQFAQEIEPQEEVEISLFYQGDVLQYRRDAYVEQAFIDKNRVYLPKEAGWYPLIGKRPLVIAYEHNNRYVNFEMRSARLIEDYPTEYTVEIETDEVEVPLALTIPEVSNGTYQGTSQYGLVLIGGNFTEFELDDIRVISPPELLPLAKEGVQSYQKSWNFVEEWLGVQMTPSTIYILNEEHYYLSHNKVNHDFFILNNASLTYINEIIYNINHELFRERGNDYLYDFSVFDAAMDWAMMNNLEEQGPFTEWYKNNRWAQEEEQNYVKLLGEYEEEGTDQILNVLKYLYYYWKNLDDELEFDMESALQQYEGESGK